MAKTTKLKFQSVTMAVQINDNQKLPLPHGMCEPHYGNHDYSSLANIIVNQNLTLLTMGIKPGFFPIEQ